MARTELVLTIFLASPGDVCEERNRLEDAISDWNRTWARNLEIRLELLRWEHDAYPDIGEDAQDVINGQIPQDYDLFIGLMWSRFGTPTVRAGSGTAEEFQRALARYKESPKDVSILFYFKDAPLSPSKVVPQQLMSVQEFKESLKNEGVLHWNFSEPEQFEKLVYMHITKHVQNWKRKQIVENSVLKDHALTQELAKTVEPSENVNIEDDDDGYLDMLDIFEERSAEVDEIAKRLTDAQLDLAARMNQSASDINALVGSPSTTPAQARRAIGKVAEEMLLFTNRVNAEVPLFRDAMNGSISALTRAATLSAEFNIEQTRTAKIAANSLLAALSGARESTVKFRDTTATVPRVTKDLNVAKRKQAAALDSLIAEFQNGEQLLVEALIVLDSLLQKARPN